jgi:hypothetical protein
VSIRPSVRPPAYNYNGQVEEDEMDRACSMTGGVHLEALEKYLTRGLSYAKAGERMNGGKPETNKESP